MRSNTPSQCARSLRATTFSTLRVTNDTQNLTPSAPLPPSRHTSARWRQNITVLQYQHWRGSTQPMQQRTILPPWVQHSTDYPIQHNSTLCRHVSLPKTVPYHYNTISSSGGRSKHDERNDPFTYYLANLAVAVTASVDKALSANCINKNVVCPTGYGYYWSHGYVLQRGADPHSCANYKHNN